MLLKTRGIVLRSHKHRESSLILDVFTEERGLRKYLINGVRARNSRVSAGLLQLMSLIELVAYERRDRDINRLKEVRPAHIYTRLPFEVYRATIGQFMTEIAHKTISEREENPALFGFLFDTFQFLDETEQGFANLHLHYLLGFSTYLGFQPAGAWSEESPLFDLREGTFIGGLPGHTYFLDEDRSHRLSLVLRCPRERLHELPITAAERRVLLEDLISYYRLHVEGLREIMSYKILREVLG